MLTIRGQLDVVATMVDSAVRAQGEEVKPEITKQMGQNRFWERKSGSGSVGFLI
ncbi:hypothetical protein DPMN_180869 [Dreissena polymorpha]|uniref:Uncharacterized protein n=1 Tax=Dreissena polymorpha TaxID=45954 RepID=A0A9D4DCK9_DREPO|nr:hypothetical protein DPMN_180869 [Dreissena polymorpha]